MSETAESPQGSSQGGSTSRRRFFRRAAVATLIAGVATGIGFKAFAHAGFGGWHRGAFMRGPIDPARLDEHLDRMLKHLYVEIDATDAQRQQLAPIVKSAAHDLLPLRTQLRPWSRSATASSVSPTRRRDA